MLFYKVTEKFFSDGHERDPVVLNEEQLRKEHPWAMQTLFLVEQTVVSAQIVTTAMSTTIQCVNMVEARSDSDPKHD